MFDLLSFFDEMIVVAKDLPKSMFVPNRDRVLFVDDEISNLIEVVSRHPKVDGIRPEDLKFERDGDFLDFEKDLEPIKVINSDDDLEDYEKFAENEDEIVVPLDKGIYVVAKVKKGKSRYIPKNDRPEKPKDGGKYELDHKVPRWKGGSDKKENLKWVSPKDHKKKTKDEGSFEKGGKDRHEQLKDKGEKSYKKYQTDRGKEKVQQEREKMGEKAFSDLQRQRAKKRWSKS